MSTRQLTLAISGFLALACFAISFHFASQAPEIKGVFPFSVIAFARSAKGVAKTIE